MLSVYICCINKTVSVELFYLEISFPNPFHRDGCFYFLKYQHVHQLKSFNSSVLTSTLHYVHYPKERSNICCFKQSETLKISAKCIWQANNPRTRNVYVRYRHDKTWTLEIVSRLNMTNNIIFHTRPTYAEHTSTIDIRIVRKADVVTRWSHFQNFKRENSFCLGYDKLELYLNSWRSVCMVKRIITQMF